MTREIERDRAVDRILTEALDRPESERAAFLEQACAGDQDLRERVELLLRLAESDDGPLETAAVLHGSIASELLGEIDDATDSGKQVGPYRLLSELGRGGAATVYLAERTEGFEQRVAVKILRSTDDEAVDIVRRFGQEREILAALEHPHIARLIDGGTTDWGSPFLVVEHVDGVPIDAYCDAGRLSIRERLRLFLDVVDAVRSAHQRLIVHRDIKPSNILVTKDGEVKLLDFGIAKLLDPEGFTHAAPLTRTAALWLTPRYASPEQLLGGRVTTATDVYQLGVLLYEILTGRPAFESTTPTPAALVSAAQARTSVRPSDVFTSPDEDEQRRRKLADCRGLSPAALASRLRGELDDIVMMATRAEPERRYGSVALLGSDIRAFLDGRPVNARGDSLSYRFRKFVGRHRLGVSVAFVLLLGLLATGAAMTVGFIHAARERSRAESIGRFLRDTLSGAQPYVARGRDTSLLEDILDDAAARLEVELEGQPIASADVRATIAKTYHALSSYDEAARHAELANATYIEILGPEARETLTTQTLLGLIYWDQGRYGEAEDLLGRVHRIASERLGPDDRATIDALTNLGLVIRAQGRLDEAEPVYREVKERTGGRYGADSEPALAATSNLSFLLAELDREEEAEQLAREAADLSRRSLGMDHPDTLLYIDKLASIVGDRGRPEEAVTLHREALSGMRRVFGERHSTTLGSAYNLSRALRRLEQYDESLETLDRILPILEQEFGHDSRYVYLTMNEMGKTLLAAGRPEDALTRFEESRRIAREVLQPEHYHHAVIAIGLSEASIESGDADRAAALLPEARRLLEETFGTDEEHRQFEELSRVESKLDGVVR